MLALDLSHLDSALRMPLLWRSASCLVKTGRHRHLIVALAALVFWVSPSARCQAQQPQIPDTVSLTDVRFFEDATTGRLFNEALAIPEEQALARLARCQMAYDRACAQAHAGDQAICATEIAGIYLRMGDVAEAFDWVNRTLELDSLIAPLSPLRQRMHRNLASIYFDFEAHKLGLPHYRIALWIDEARSPEPTPRRFRYCSSLAIGFQKAGQIDSAFACYRRCVAIAESLQDRVWRASALNNYGMALLGVGKLDSALAIFEHAYEVLQPDNDERSLFAVSIRDNIGDALMRLERPAEALTQYDVNYADHALRPNEGMHLQAGIKRVLALCKLNRATDAKSALADAVAFSAQIPTHVRAHFRHDLLHARIAAASIQGQWQLASVLQEELLQFQDSLRSHALRTKVSTLQDMLLDKSAHFKTELALSRLHAAEASVRARTQALLVLSLALLAILSLTVILLVYRRRAERLKARHESERYNRELAELGLKNERLENAQLNQRLEMKQRDITDYALVYSQRRKIFEDILENLRQIKRSPHPEANLQDLIIAIKGKLDSEGKLNLESQHIDNVNHAYFAQLKQRFPDLGSGELELCGMIRLGYSAKDIASMRNIAPSSVRIAKTRLKKKMNLAANVDLNTFLNEI